jgi:hypothetical protein
MLSEDKKLADMNVGCVKVDAIFDCAPRLALTFGDCGSLSVIAAAFRLPGGGYSSVPQ